MASNKTVRFVIKAQTEGGEEIKALKVKSEDLRAAIQSAQKVSSKGIRPTVRINGYEKATSQLKSLKGMMGSFGGAFGNIGLPPAIANIGSTLANPYVLAGAAAVTATKAIFDYNKELDRTLQRTAQFTGLSGQELQQLRAGIQSTANTFGKDFDTVLSAVDGMMNQFGIGGEEALQIIRNGFIGGADEGGRMLEMINRYSGAFKDAGISASELVAIIGNTRNGIFSEEGMELFAKGATRIREFSSKLRDSLDAVGIGAEEMYQKLQSGEMTTVEAIKQISDRLKDLNPQSQEVGNVLKQVFGKEGAKAGLELVTALSEVETNLDIVKGQTGELGASMERLEKANREFESAMASFFGTASGGFASMTNDLKAKVYGAVAKVINGFIDWYNDSLLIRSSIANISLAFKNAWELISAILKLMMNSFKSLASLIEGVFTLDWEKVKGSWKSGLETLLKTVATGFENIKNNYVDAFDQTLNGQLQKIEVPVEAEYSANTSNNGGSTSSPTPEIGGSSSSKSGKKSAVKEQVEAEAGSIKALQKQVQALNDELNNTNVSDERLKQILEEKSALEEQIKVLQERAGLIKPEKVPEVKVEPELPEGSLAKIEKELSEKEAQLKMTAVGSEEYYKLADSIAKLTGQKNVIELQIEKDTIDDTSKSLQEFEKRKKEIDETTGAINQMGSAFGSLGSAIAGTGGEWMSFVGSTIQAMTQLIAQIVTMITAKEAEAMAGAAASGSGIGFPQNIAAIAAGVAAVTSIFASLPKFADGGIISGPTIGLMGEYAGASGNPEVVAPLDRLQELIGEPAGVPVIVSGKLHGVGSELIGVISNCTRVASRSGKRSNIKI